MACNNCHHHLVPMTMRDMFWDDPFFASNFRGFDRFRDEMLEQSRNIWSNFDRQLQQSSTTESNSSIKETTTKKEVSSKTEKNGSSSSTSLAPIPPMFPRQFLRMFSEDFPTDFTRSRFTDTEVIRMHEDDKVFEISLDTHNYKPEEVKVTVDQAKKVLKVEAKHEEKNEETGKFSQVTRQFSRQYTLPENCKPEEVVSNLSADGVLMVSAPKQAKGIEGTRQVPIEMKK